MLEIRLNGSIEAIRDGEPVSVSGRRIRALLALLALSPGQTVSVDALARGIWDEDPPERVRGSLQTYVGRLRRVLGDGVVVTGPAGYALDVPRGSVDLLAISDSVETLAQSRGPDAERDALRAVLDRWHGEPFGDAPSEWIARHERPVWVERRLQVFERWVDLSFAAGRHEACVVELNRQVERHPLRETLWTRLLVALDRAGRTAEALDRYESVRKRLAEELGVDPSPELRAAYLELLKRSDEHAGGAEPATVPRQLPARVGGFVGREEQLARMDGLLPEPASEDGGAVIALHGPAGSGKTTLALHWAHRVKNHFPDGQLFLNLQGYGPGERLTTGRALDRLIRGLGVPGKLIPEDLDERAAMLRGETDGRRLLVLLDNVQDSEHVRPLLPGSGVVVVVTSRTELRGLVTREAASRVGLDQMSPQESVALLERRLTGAASRSDLLELADMCGHLPVALAVAAERVGRDSHSDRPIAALSAQLRDRKRRLDALTSWEDDPLTSVRAVLDWSYQALDDDSAHLLRHLGLYEAPRISAGAAAALAGVDVDGVARPLDRLADCHLLSPRGGGWYVMHDLVCDFAAETVAEVESDAERAAATRRLRSWFLHSARSARDACNPPRAAQPLPEPEPGVTAAVFATDRSASDWLAANIDHLRALVDAAVGEDDPTGYLLAPLLFGYLNLTAALTEAEQMYQAAERSALRAGSLIGQAECANCLGGVYSDKADDEAALDCATRARDLHAAAGDLAGQLRAESNVALTLGRLGRNDDAIATCERIIEVAQAHDLPQHLAIGLADVSEAYREAGRIDDALRAGAEAVERLRSLPGRVLALANALESLGDAQVAKLRYDAAVDSYREGRGLLRGLGRGGFEAGTLTKLGRIYRELGRLDDARVTWTDALRALGRQAVAESRDASRADLLGLLESLDES